MEDKKPNKSSRQIEELIQSIIDEQQLIIVDIESFKEQNIVILLYSKNEQLDIEKLGMVHKQIYAVLETAPFLNENFTLEVSSPGIFRKFKNIREFEIFKDREIKILTDQDETYIGISKGIEEGNTVIMDLKNSEIFKINIKKKKKAGLNG
ncbi:MAG: hypothetical protein MJB14_16615 [Spirochaetes bacterium]|nr:hypothetical protein [Spirochaetota bacterium]